MQAPSGSSAAVANPVGAVTVSNLWAYQYNAGQLPTAKPDTAGTYILQLTGNLSLLRTAPTRRSRAPPHSLTLTVGSSGAKVAGTDAAGGCTTATGLAPLLGLGLGLGLLLRRRRS